MATIHQPLDVLGVNIYFGRVVRAGKDGTPESVPAPRVAHDIATQDTKKNNTVPCTRDVATVARSQGHTGGFIFVAGFPFFQNPFPTGASTAWQVQASCSPRGQNP